MELANSLAYYDMATITAVKSFKVQTPGKTVKLNLSIVIKDNVIP